MKIPMLASSIKTGEKVWVVPTGRKTAVMITVTEVLSSGDGVTLTVVGERTTARGVTRVSCRMFAFTRVSLEM